MDKQIKSKINSKVQEFKEQIQEIMPIESTELALAMSMVKRFLYKLTVEEAQHLSSILQIISETDSEDLEDIINEAIQQYTTPEQKPYIDAIIGNDKVRDLLETGKLKVLTQSFAQLLRDVYG